MDTDRSENMPNVVLTGFMGTGKSTVGRLVATALGYEWVDTDAVITSRHGPIIEIFSNNGEEAFRDMERSLAAELAAQDGLVISTGGRMMLDEQTAAVLGAEARVFCLTAGVDEILRRVGAQEGPPRPLLGLDHPADRIAALMAEREAGYQSFEQVATDGKTIGQVAADVLQRLDRRGDDQRLQPAGE